MNRLKSEELNEVQLNLELNTLGYRVLVKESTGSTNDDLKKLAFEWPSGSIIIANQQTQGRGRLDRNFQSNKGKGIYLSLLLKSNLQQQNHLKLPIKCAVAVQNTLSNYVSQTPQIKWPNDILIDSKKVCGILIESMIQNQDVLFVIGIGINVFHQDFEGNLRSTATTLDSYTNIILDRNQVIIDLIKAIHNELNKPFEDSISNYKQKMLTQGTELKVMHKGLTYLANVESLTQQGYLVVMDKQKELHTLIADEVQLVVHFPE